MQISRRNFFRTTFSASAVSAAAVLVGSIPFSEEAFGEPRRSWLLDPAASPETASPVLLNSNENAYGPWPSMMPVMRDALALGHRYPDSQYQQLIAKIAELHRVKEDQIVLG